MTVQNVVTYSTVIDVPNPELKLKPGMTANVNIEIARRDNVLRVPNAAIRFRPTEDIFDALKQAMPPELERGPGGRGPRGGRRRQRAGRRRTPRRGGCRRARRATPAAAPLAPGTATAGQAQAQVQANQRQGAGRGQRHRRRWRRT